MQKNSLELNKVVNESLQNFNKVHNLLKDKNNIEYKEFKKKICFQNLKKLIDKQNNLSNLEKEILYNNLCDLYD